MSLRRQGDKPLANRVVEREMRELPVRLVAMEEMKRREPDTRDISDAESEEDVGENVIEEDAGEEVGEERLLREVARLEGRSKIEVPMYEGNLDAKELLDWIRSMDNHFDYEDVDEERKVKLDVTRLKGHATLLCNEL
jgi:hypothetical protein